MQCVRHIIGLTLMLCCMSASADQYIQGYTRSDGTYVQGHHRSNPDHNPYNNYSSSGNSNPYTGERGSVSAYQNFGSNNSLTPSPYSSNRSNRYGFDGYNR